MSQQNKFQIENKETQKQKKLDSQSKKQLLKDEKNQINIEKKNQAKDLTESQQKKQEVFKQKKQCKLNHEINIPSQNNEKVKESQNFIKIQKILNPKRPLQIVAISDTHGDFKTMNQILSLKGDIFIHAGDFTYHGKDEHFTKFFDFLGKINFKYKIVISGNHQNILSTLKLKCQTKMTREKILQEFKKKCIYLEHQTVNIEGINIFGSPFTPEFCQKPKGRAFQYKPNYEKVIWDQIPTKTDILITHGPPYGILDVGKHGKNVGSKYLLQKVKKIKPKYHIFGHIHQAKGMNKLQETIFLNVTNTPTRLIWK